MNSSLRFRCWSEWKLVFAHPSQLQHPHTLPRTSLFRTGSEHFGLYIWCHYFSTVWVWDNHIKTSEAYEEYEEAIEDNPERVDDFNKALDYMGTYFELTYLGRLRSDLMALAAGGPGSPSPSPPDQSMHLSLRTQSSEPIVSSLGTQCLNWQLFPSPPCGSCFFSWRRQHEGQDDGN